MIINADGDSPRLWQECVLEGSSTHPSTALICETIPVLEVIWSAMLLLQRDHALAEDYVPTVQAMCTAIEQLPRTPGLAECFQTSFCAEFRLAEQRDLSDVVPAMRHDNGIVYGSWCSLITRIPRVRTLSKFQENNSREQFKPFSTRTKTTQEIRS